MRRVRESAIRHPISLIYKTHLAHAGVREASHWYCLNPVCATLELGVKLRTPWPYYFKANTCPATFTLELSAALTDNAAIEALCLESEPLLTIAPFCLTIPISKPKEAPKIDRPNSLALPNS